LRFARQTSSTDWELTSFPTRRSSDLGGKPMRMVYILGGVIAFALGTVGTVLPVLPTVPFYLLATWCFAKSSRRLHDWLHARTLYQKHMTPFFNGEGLSIRQKVTMMSIDRKSTRLNSSHVSI